MGQCLGKLRGVFCGMTGCFHLKEDLAEDQFTSLLQCSEASYSLHNTLRTLSDSILTTQGERQQMVSPSFYRFRDLEADLSRDRPESSIPTELVPNAGPLVSLTCSPPCRPHHFGHHSWWAAADFCEKQSEGEAAFTEHSPFLSLSLSFLFELLTQNRYRAHQVLNKAETSQMSFSQSYFPNNCHGRPQLLELRVSSPLGRIHSLPWTAQ